ncbi:MAG TPA: hypothetical protein VJQ56_02820, partial [Blastocatellia bacterium]|nr:hypothetical protein [Blastocatellia bacterium]
MKKSLFSLTMVTALFLTGLASLHTARHTKSSRQQSGLDKPDAESARLAERKRNFEPIRKMMMEKGVPFDPDVLLSADWPTRLAPVFARMPEMQTVRYHKLPLAGVQLAGTLYLPEKVQLAGDTIILARHIIFEGDDAVIRGNHSIHFLPIETAGVMGMTLKEFRLRSKELNPNREIDDESHFPAEPAVKEGGRITIDTHGEGYAEWLERMGGEDRVKGLIRRFQKGDKASLNIVQDKSGMPGAMGKPGAQADSAIPADPPIEAKGADGVCGDSTTVQGGEGVTGADGGDGGKGGDGSQGNRGGDGKPISVTIPDNDTQTWDLRSHGGQGGEGGPGAPGAAGAPGGRGGEGGTGATCPCNQGGAGN